VGDVLAAYAGDEDVTPSQDHYLLLAVFSVAHVDDAVEHGEDSLANNA
jgi:hypothetical protein